MDAVGTAIMVATEAHDGQLDKAGLPYILHPLRVGAALYAFGADYVVAGILHDVVEDTPVTLEDLSNRGFNDAVLSAVASVTKTESERTWEAYQKSIAKAMADPVGGWVKASDVADNWGRLDADALGPEVYWRLMDKYVKARAALKVGGFDPDNLTPDSP